MVPHPSVDTLQTPLGERVVYLSKWKLLLRLEMHIWQLLKVGLCLMDTFFTGVRPVHPAHSAVRNNWLGVGFPKILIESEFPINNNNNLKITCYCWQALIGLLDQSKFKVMSIHFGLPTSSGMLSLSPPVIFSARGEQPEDQFDSTPKDLPKKCGGRRELTVGSVYKNKHCAV